MAPGFRGALFRSRGQRRFGVSRLAGMGGLIAVGCSQGAAGPPTLSILEMSVPTPNASLNESPPTKGGLLQGLGPDGWPVLDGTGVDPLVLEARRFYDRVGAPAPDGTAATAPMTIDDWKQAFGFSPRSSNETLDAFRARNSVAVYYNKNELGLGRELGCAQFVDGQDGSGQAIMGIACYVTNYGGLFRDQDRSLQAAIDGVTPKNTVCIAYRPTFDAGYQVQFYVYGHDGTRQDWAQLDTLGPRPHPLVCMNCHGGQYDSQAHLARGARFLPLDPNLVVFASDTGAAASLSREAQEERIRSINALAAVTPLSPGQQDAFQGLYAGNVATPGQTSLTDWVPASWQGSDPDRQLYAQIIKPYCATCHLAMQASAGQSPSTSNALLMAPATFRSFPVTAFLCNDFVMPNAQPTMHGFWGERADPIVIGDQAYATAADAMLAQLGSDRESCPHLGEVANCNRSANPDALCGDVHSGTACDRATGRCVPAMSGDPSASAPAPPVGICRLDGTRGCPYTLVCRPSSGGSPGLDGYDGACVPCGGDGQPACDQGDACASGLVVSDGGLCGAG